VRFSTVVRYAAALATMVAATAATRLAGADLTVAAMVLLLAVLFAALLGPGPGALAAVAGYFLYDYYYTPPVHHFDFQEGTNIIAGVAFFVAAAIIGWVVTTITRLRARESKRAREAQLRLDLLRRVDAGEPPDRLARHLEVAITELFALRGCVVHLGDPPGAASDTHHGGAAGLTTFTAGRATVEIAEPRERLHGGDRELLQALVVTLDASLEQARLRRESAEATIALQLSRSRAGLVSAVSHNLRTPLASIRAAAATLRAPDAHLNADDRRELLAIMADESERLERMVAKTLDLSRIRAGGLELEPQTVDIGDLVSAAVRRIRPLGGHDAVRLDLDPDLEPVTLDIGLIEDVVLNLLENALRFAPSGSPIIVGAATVDDSVELRVTDQGPGVAPHERERIFEEFVRGEMCSDPAGTGLGLAIVRAHVTAHGGSVWVEEAPGGGARFVVRLPRGVPT